MNLNYPIIDLSSVKIAESHDKPYSTDIKITSLYEENSIGTYNDKKHLIGNIENSTCDWDTKKDKTTLGNEFVDNEAEEADDELNSDSSETEDNNSDSELSSQSSNNLFSSSYDSSFVSSDSVNDIWFKREDPTFIPDSDDEVSSSSTSTLDSISLSCRSDKDDSVDPEEYANTPHTPTIRSSPTDIDLTSSDSDNVEVKSSGDEYERPRTPTLEPQIDTIETSENNVVFQTTNDLETHVPTFESIPLSLPSSPYYLLTPTRNSNIINQNTHSKENERVATTESRKRYTKKLKKRKPRKRLFSSSEDDENNKRGKKTTDNINK